MNYLQNDFNQEELLLDADVFIRAKKKRFKGSRIVCVAVPVVAYRYEVKTNSYQEDFLSDAVCKLRDFYAKNGNKECVNDISKDLGLSTSLVKAIIKEDEQARSLAEEDNGEKRTIRTTNFVVLFDKIAQQLLPYVMSSDDYESKKDACDDMAKYQTSIGDSTKYYIHKLCLPSGVGAAPLTPSTEEVSALLRQRVFANKKRRNELFRILFSGISEERYLVTALYYDKSNAVEFCAENPFSSGRAPWMVQDVRHYLDKKYPYAQKLRDSMEKMAESVDKTATSNPERKNSLWQSCEEYLLKVYGSDILDNQPELKDKLVCALEKYTKMIHFCQNEDGEDVMMQLEESRRDYYVAIQNLIEIVFSYAFIANYESTKQKDYHAYLEQVEISNYCIYDYRKLARILGFDESQISKSAKFRKSDMYFAISNLSENADIHVHIFGCLLEAKFNKEHPLWQVAVEYPNFFEYLSELEYLRNPSKHGNNDEIAWNSLDFQKFAFNLFDLMVAKKGKKNENAIDYNKFINHEGIGEDYKLLESMAQNSIQKYPHILNNPDAYNRALALEKAFEAQSGEYYSKAYNMIDEVLKQLVVSVSDHNNEIDRAFLNGVFHGEYTKDSIAEKAEAVLQQYDCSYHFKNRYNAENFGKASYSARLSLGNRVYYFILLADHRKPGFLRRFLSENTQFFAAVEQVTDPLSGRGHSNITDFEKADIATLHKEVLNNSEHIVGYIEELEEDRQ